MREACRAIAADARHVRLDLSAAVTPGEVPPLDAEVHFVDGTPSQVAAYILTLDAINFGSGWFHELALSYEEVAGALTEQWREHGELVVPIGLLLGRDHLLMDLYDQALRELDAWLGDRRALDVVQGAASAAALVDALASMALWRDTGFLKRAQIAVNDLALAGVVAFDDVDDLTAFADNCLPQVLRVDGVLVVDDALAARIARGEELPAGSREEQELRACAVHACELLAPRLGMTPRGLDNLLWTRGQGPDYASVPLHRTHTTYY